MKRDVPIAVAPSHNAVPTVTVSPMNVPRLLVWIACVVGAAASRATPLVEVRAGCQLNLPGLMPGEALAWWGECRDSWAHGPGLATSSHGSHWVGRLVRGTPVDGVGLWTLMHRNGSSPLTVLRQAQGLPHFSPLPLPSAGTPFAPKDIDALVGLWRWRTLDGRCEATLDVDAQGRARWHRVPDGPEVQEAWALLGGPPGGVHALLRTRAGSGPEKDCAGHRMDHGDTVFTQVVQEGADAWRWCTAQGTAHCTAGLVRWDER